MKLSHVEAVILMRSLLRSLEKTPESERAGHQAIYERLSKESIRTLPTSAVRRLGAAIDHAIGR